jgi:hypothetical protein
MIKAILVFCLFACAFATSASMEASAADAVDSGLDVLKGLKQTNIDAQALADAQNKTSEAAMKLEIGDLTALADSNKENGDAATEHRKYIENEINVTN